MAKTKTHFAQIDYATEAYNYDEWYNTLCGLDSSAYDVKVTDKIQYVNCKKCLKAFPKYCDNIDKHIRDHYE